MVAKFTALLCCFFALFAFDPEWLRPDWSGLDVWLISVPPEEAAAAGLRLLALGGLATQIFGVTMVWLGSLIGSGATVRISQRILLPVLRTVVPLAVAVGPAAPAVASEGGLPAFPPPVTTRVSHPQTASVVTVSPGDSMWTIAAAHATGDVGRYWREVVDINRDRFDDVDVIHPGDVVLLPGSGRQADPDAAHPIVDVGVDDDDGLPGAEPQSAGDHRDDDRGSDPGGQHVVSPMAGRTVPMTPPVVGG